MTALDTLYNIINNDNLNNANLKCCLVDEDKVPYKINGERCKPNTEEDFSNLLEIVDCSTLNKYKGIGISVNFSGISAIDIDHCFKEAFNFDSINDKALNIVEMFCDYYIEFSFSGTGIRILFKSKNIDNYNSLYYIKNSNENIEYYNPSSTYRYVTLTGRTIIDNPIKNVDEGVLISFLDKYMKRPTRKKIVSSAVEDKEINELLIDVRKLYFKNPIFQDVWFAKAPGSGKNESELDYSLIYYLYEYITKDVEKIKMLFMESPFFKSKDRKHYQKFTKDNFKYFYNTCERII